MNSLCLRVGTCQRGSAEWLLSRGSRGVSFTHGKINRVWYSISILGWNGKCTNQEVYLNIPGRCGGRFQWLKVKKVCQSHPEICIMKIALQRGEGAPFKYLLNTYIAQSSTPAWFASTCSKLAMASKKDADMICQI